MNEKNLLSSAEMKKVMGGVITKETWMQMCVDGKFGGGDTGNGTVQDNIYIAICEALYEEMVV